MDGESRSSSTARSGDAARQLLSPIASASTWTPSVHFPSLGTSIVPSSATGPAIIPRSSKRMSGKKDHHPFLPLDCLSLIPQTWRTHSSWCAMLCIWERPHSGRCQRMAHVGLSCPFKKNEHARAYQKGVPSFRAPFLLLLRTHT